MDRMHHVAAQTCRSHFTDISNGWSEGPATRRNRNVHCKCTSCVRHRTTVCHVLKHLIPILCKRCRRRSVPAPHTAQHQPAVCRPVKPSVRHGRGESEQVRMLVPVRPKVGRSTRHVKAKRRSTGSGPRLHRREGYVHEHHVNIAHAPTLLPRAYLLGAAATARRLHYESMEVGGWNPN